MNPKSLSLFLLTTSLLTAPLSAQVFPDQPDFDKYGGYRNLKGEVTGRFHLEVIDGRHFLITPDGQGFISLGVTHTQGLGNPEESRYDFLKQTLSGDWNKANADLLAKFRNWGYNSLGYGSHPTTREHLPHFASGQPSGKVSSWMGKMVEYPDVFSDTWKQQARRVLERMAKTYDVESPNLIGVYWTDMPSWDLKRARQRNGTNWVDAIRALPDDAPGKVKYEAFLRENGEDASDEDFLVLIAREIYTHIGPLTRDLFPDTLVFGERYAGVALPGRVIQEALPYIDVVSVQPNAINFPAENLERLYQETQKPIMICDHQVSFNTPEHSNVMWHTLPDMASIDKAYASYMDEGFATSFVIGYNRCQYIDRYKGGQKILKQGLLQVDGKPYEELVESVRKNNWQVHRKFLGKE